MESIYPAPVPGPVNSYQFNTKRFKPVQIGVYISSIVVSMVLVTIISATLTILSLARPNINPVYEAILFPLKGVIFPVWAFFLITVLTVLAFRTVLYRYRGQLAPEQPIGRLKFVLYELSIISFIILIPLSFSYLTLIVGLISGPSRGMGSIFGWEFYPILLALFVYFATPIVLNIRLFFKAKAIGWLFKLFVIVVTIFTLLFYYGSANYNNQQYYAVLPPSSPLNNCRNLATFIDADNKITGAEENQNYQTRKTYGFECTVIISTEGNYASRIESSWGRYPLGEYNDYVSPIKMYVDDRLVDQRGFFLSQGPHNLKLLFTSESKIPFEEITLTEWKIYPKISAFGILVYRPPVSQLGSTLILRSPP